MARFTKTTVIAGGVTALIALGGAGAIAAHADSSSSTPTSAASTAPTSSAAKTKTHKAHSSAAMHDADVLHAQWVTKGKGGYVTHDAIRGMVTAASPTSITVKSADGVTQTYAESSATKVRVGHGKGSKPTTGSVSDIKTGSTVLVMGTGTTSLTAERVGIKG